MLVIQTKEEIYDTLSSLITDFEHPENVKDYDKINWANTFYDMLVIIQNRWEDTITAQED